MIGLLRPEKALEGFIRFLGLFIRGPQGFSEGLYGIERPIGHQRTSSGPSKAYPAPCPPHAPSHAPCPITCPPPRRLITCPPSPAHDMARAIFFPERSSTVRGIVRSLTVRSSIVKQWLKLGVLRAPLAFCASLASLGAH